MALQKKHKRLLAYAAILGGCAVLAITFFTISQYEKAKYHASVSMELVSEGRLDKLKKADPDALTNTESKYHAAAEYWNDIYEHFTYVTKVNSAAYVGTAIPAYVFSMSTLVAFGLILKHAETAKEKEDEEAVLGPRT